jgi:hypothetical protein
LGGFSLEKIILRITIYSNIFIFMTVTMKTMHNGFFPQFLYWIFQFTDFSQDYSDSLPYLKKKPKRTIKNYGSAARLDQAIVIKDKFLKILLLALSFSFSQYPEFLKFIGHIGPRGQKIMRSANMTEATFNQTNFWFIYFSFLWHKILILIHVFNMFIFV